MSARSVLDDYKRLINHHDFDLLEPLISSECKFWFSSGTYHGLADARKAFERAWGLIKNEVYTISDVDWICEGDRAAACTYVFHWTGEINGQHQEGTGRGTSCFGVENGRWKLVHEHLSAFPKES